ncbi:MAG: PEP-CTERM-box response regulator transcription factor [Verrucomicrobiota bacterium]|jgi:two-component system NtrC family response regulator|nr:PEP-CTERM-box response regulator transcription factor [Opitutaceae bacterium]
MENAEKPGVLIVDDDEALLTQLRWSLGDEYRINVAKDRIAAMAALRETPAAAVLLDLGLPPDPASPAEGLALIAAILRQDPAIRVIALSGQPAPEQAASAVGHGACDFLAKPIDPEELRSLVRRACRAARWEREYLARLPSLAPVPLGGGGPAMQTVASTVRKVAASEAPVLILGESGTGKEMTARAIHDLGPRRAGPFVAINCSAIPETLIESELFGHERGAFTGAHQQRRGRVESAAGGTLFLDEIGDVPLGVQVKLLRFLQEQTIQRVGGRTELAVDTRVIAATNADLQRGMREGTFREDFFYRLAVVRIALPPLRDRGEEVVTLARTFLGRFGEEQGRRGLRLSEAAEETLRAHPWPGNIRELQNRVRRAVIMAESRRIEPSDLELIAQEKPAAASLRDARDSLERDLIRRSLDKHAGRIAPAAAELGISRPTLYERLDRLGLPRPS